MFEIGKSQIINSILHVLNAKQEKPLYSDFMIDSDDSISLDFAMGSIEKILSSSEMKYAEFIQGSEIRNLLEQLANGEMKFKKTSEDIAVMFFNLLKNNPGVNSADLLITLFEMNNARYICVTKHNYKSFITREIKNIRDSNNISIIKEQSFLFSSKPKLDESFIVNLDTLEIAMIDKKYDINGEKADILEEYILNCKPYYSDKDKVNIFNKVLANIESKYISDMQSKIDIKKAVCGSFFEDEILSIDRVLNNSFNNDKQLHDIAKESFEKAGIKDVPIDLKEINKKYSFQTITTEDGIEIKVPVNLFQSKLEFIENEDGSVNISINNINMLGR